MRLDYDRAKIEEGINNNAYDERNLAICRCRKHHYPSKLMFIRFLEQFPNVQGVADIWSNQNLNDGTVTIHVEVKYKVEEMTKEQ